MMKGRWIQLIGLTLLLTIRMDCTELAPTEILDRIDRNMVFSTARSEVEMILTIGSRTIRKTLVSWSSGTESAFIEFLSPARDKGTRILKLDGVIRIFYPSAERVVRLSGHMLRQSMMGSDFSFEDMTERSKKLREEYRAVLIGEEPFDQRPCYVLELTSTTSKQTYHTRKVWVDRERFLGLKEEMYSRSGKLLKIMCVEETQNFDGRSYPVRVRMEDKLRQGTHTVMQLNEIEFDIDIPRNTFSERNLLRR